MRLNSVAATSLTAAVVAASCILPALADRVTAVEAGPGGVSSTSVHTHHDGSMKVRSTSVSPGGGGAAVSTRSTSIGSDGAGGVTATRHHESTAVGPGGATHHVSNTATNVGPGGSTTVHNSATTSTP